MPALLLSCRVAELAFRRQTFRVLPLSLDAANEQDEDGDPLTLANLVASDGSWAGKMRTVPVAWNGGKSIVQLLAKQRSNVGQLQRANRN